MSAATELPSSSVRPAGSPPTVIVPDADVFAGRAKRFTRLARGHALGEWLSFLGAISQAQHACLQNLADLPLPDAQARARAIKFGMPPVPAAAWPRDPAWQTILRTLSEDVARLAPPPLQSALERLNERPSADREKLADRVLHLALSGPDADVLPLVAAALQTCWTHLAISLGSEGIPCLDLHGVCPCCGFLPVGSIVKTVGDVSNVRYLHCALCNTQWNYLRVKCATCETTENIAYRHLEGKELAAPDAVRAETCESCKSYMKIIYQEKGALDPVADDLASLALDMLVDEAGYGRAGPNLLLVPGSG